MTILYLFIVDDPPSPPPNEEGEGSRYPKRNITRKRYDEIEIPNEDEYICKYTVQTTCGKYTNMDNFMVSIITKQTCDFSRFLSRKQSLLMVCGLIPKPSERDQDE